MRLLRSNTDATHVPGMRCRVSTSSNDAGCTDAVSTYTRLSRRTTGTRTGKAKSLMMGPKTTSPMAGRRLFITVSKLAASTTRASGSPKLRRVLTSCSPVGDSSTTLYQPGWVATARSASA